MSVALDSTVPAPLTAEPPFSDRFQVRGVLGRGGMGTVYRALDLETGELVALKTLHFADPEAVYALKREFRALSQIDHPNLIRLHELYTAPQPFFSMELVDGIDALEHVRQGVAPGDPPDERGLQRLIAVALRIIDALTCLHAHGRLHRDLKPANVLVAERGRVVVLDLGISAHPGARPTFAVGAGTPGYMAPEQACGGPQGPAVDVYSLGCLLGQALIGLPSRSGPAADGPAPDGPAAPTLSRLRLLATQMRSELSEARPTLRQAQEVLAGLGGRPVESPTYGELPLIGRATERTGILAAVDRPGPRVVLVPGASGIGKSRLLRACLDDRSAAGALVLSGRCDPNETVPFKALDQVIDSLARSLRSGAIPRPRLTETQTSAVWHLFPVLAAALSPARPAPRADPVDPSALRWQGFTAMRAILSAVAEGVPLLLWLDDIQWTDADSVDLLESILARPQPTPLVCVLSFRPEDVDPSSEGARLLEVVRRQEVPVTEVPLGPLPLTDLLDLATALGVEAGAAGRLAEASGGSPLFLGELARGFGRGEDVRDLDALIRGRVERLEGGSRLVLEMLCLLGSGIAYRALVRAVPASTSALHGLLAACLIRRTPVAGQVLLVPFHDRVREAVVDALQPDRRRELHGRIAEVLESAEDGRIELRAQHLIAAGGRGVAARTVLRAADAAAGALAFAKAVDLYTLALSLSGGSEADILERRSDMLAALGRASEAADGYLHVRRLAEGAGAPIEALAGLERRAAEQFLRAGRTNDGRGLLRTALARLGVQPPGSRLGALSSIVWRRCKRALRGLVWGGGEPSERSRAALDALWAATTGLALYDQVESEFYGIAFLDRALGSGEIPAIARALGYEAVYRGRFAGSWFARGALGLAADGVRLSEQAGTPYDRGWTWMCKAFVHYAVGEDADNAAASKESLSAFRACATDTAWERARVELWRTTAAWWSGDVRTVREIGHRASIGRGDAPVGADDMGHYRTRCVVAAIEGRVEDAVSILATCEAR